MTMVIMNNGAAMQALRENDKNSNKLSKDLQKVASGMKINGAGDGAAEYAVSEKMRVMIRSLGQDIENAKKGIDLVKIAEEGMQNIVDQLRDMKAMAIDSANDHNSDADRAILQKEFASRMAGIDNIASTTNYNGKILMDGRYWYKEFDDIDSANGTMQTNGLMTSLNLNRYQSASFNSVWGSPQLMKSRIFMKEEINQENLINDSRLKNELSDEKLLKKNNIDGNLNLDSTKSVSLKSAINPSEVIVYDPNTPIVYNSTISNLFPQAAGKVKHSTFSWDRDKWYITGYSPMPYLKAYGGTSTTLPRYSYTEIKSTYGSVGYQGPDDWISVSGINRNIKLVEYSGYNRVITKYYTASDLWQLPLEKELGLDINSNTYWPTVRIVENPLTGMRELMDSDYTNPYYPRNPISIEQSKDCMTVYKLDFSNIQGTLPNALDNQGFTIMCAGCYQDIAIKFDAERPVGEGTKLTATAKRPGPGAANGGPEYVYQETYAYVIGVQGVRNSGELKEAIFQGLATATGTDADKTEVTLADYHTIKLVKKNSEYYLSKSVSQDELNLGADSVPRMVLIEGFEGKLMGGDTTATGKNEALPEPDPPEPDPPEPDPPEPDPPEPDPPEPDPPEPDPPEPDPPEPDPPEPDPPEPDPPEPDPPEPDPPEPDPPEPDPPEPDPPEPDPPEPDPPEPDPPEPDPPEPDPPKPDDNEQGYKGRRFEGNPLIIHYGPKQNQHLRVYINDMHTKAMGLKDVVIDPLEKAREAMGKLDGALDYALNEITRMGAYQKKLQYTIDNNTTAEENVTSAESVIRDADMAQSMMNYVKDNILTQTSQAMLAQANQNSGAVLRLLQ